MQCSSSTGAWFLLLIPPPLYQRPCVWEKSDDRNWGRRPTTNSTLPIRHAWIPQLSTLLTACWKHLTWWIYGEGYHKVLSQKYRNFGEFMEGIFDSELIMKCYSRSHVRLIKKNIEILNWKLLYINSFTQLAC